MAGRQATYSRYFFERFTADSTAITEADLAHYAIAYRDPGHLRSAFEFYRAMPANAAHNAARTDPIDVPLLLAGGEYMFGPIMPRLADTLRSRHGWTDVRVEIIEGAKRYLVEEQPDRVAEVIERHATSPP